VMNAKKFIKHKSYYICSKLEQGIMKKIIFILICLCFVTLAFADDLKIKSVIKPDPLRGGQNYLLLNDDGNEKARIKPDPLRSGRYLILDKKGNERGIIRPDYLWSDRLVIEKKK